MKKNLLLFTILALISISCSQKSKQDNKNNNLKENLEKLLLYNYKIKDSITKVFDNSPLKEDKIFKVILSRKENFLRVTIYQMFNLKEIKQVPEQIIFGKESAYLCYNGNELLENRKVNLDSINKILNSNRLLLKNTDKIDLIDTRYLQFDFFSWEKIKFNNPIYFDFNQSEKNIKFK